MKKIAVYVEGGGGSSSQQGELRQGFDQLFRSQKLAASANGVSLRFVCCGSRNDTHIKFIGIRRLAEPGAWYGLLVDAEDEIGPESPKPKDETPEAATLRKLADARKRKDHLVRRDGWPLQEVPPDCIHLMVRCMEAWIVADPEALEEYYSKGFKTKKLPASNNLENEPKVQVYAKLENATKDTTKGAYEKIKHASKLLGFIDPIKISARCPRFASFAGWLEEQISNA